MTHTLHLIRALTAARIIKPKRRIGRWPAPIEPKSIWRSYHAATVREVCDPARAEFRAVEPEIYALLTRLRRQQGRTDAAPDDSDLRRLRARAGITGHDLGEASDEGKEARRLIEHAAREFARKFHPGPLTDVVSQFGRATDRHSRLQLDKQLRSAIGVPLSAVERPSTDRLGEWTATNVGYIKTIPERYFDRLQQDVQEAFAGGTHPSTLAEQFSDAYGISSDDAMRIARTETLKLSADLSHDRMQNLGVTRYKWRDAGDGRVREWHLELARQSDAGETFAFDDPPMGGGTDEDESGNPGSGIQCRCYADPDLSALLG